MVDAQGVVADAPESLGQAVGQFVVEVVGGEAEVDAVEADRLVGLRCAKAKCALRVDDDPAGLAGRGVARNHLAEVERRAGLHVEGHIQRQPVVAGLDRDRAVLFQAMPPSAESVKASAIVLPAGPRFRRVGIGAHAHREGLAPLAVVLHQHRGGAGRASGASACRPAVRSAQLIRRVHGARLAEPFRQAACLAVGVERAAGPSSRTAATG